MAESRGDRTLNRDFKGVRVAWFTNAGGIPFESEIRRVVNANRNAFADLGCVVEEAEPDFVGVDEAFPILRHLSYHANYARLARENPTIFKATVKWGIAEAGCQTRPELARASRFFDRYEYFVLPVTQVEPFDITTEYPMQVAGEQMPTYIDWMRSCWYVTFMACPAISVPGGFTANGLPVGLQIVARRRNDFGLLQIAHAFEQATKFGERKPVL